MRDKARRHVELIVRALGLDGDFTGKTVLELGTGRGWLAHAIATEGGAERVIGIDVAPADEWQQLAHPRLTYATGDLARDRLVDPRTVDHVVSTAVFEHITRPIEMLRQIRRALRPGGSAWLRFNLHASAIASHRYDTVNFPWPHLLFDDHVLDSYFAKHGIRDSARHTERAGRFAWVNALSLAHYLEACREVRLRVVSLHRRVRPIDIDFYLRFESILGRYPALDLETDFATLVVERPARRRFARLRRNRTRTVKAGYSKRQRRFARDLERARLEREATARLAQLAHRPVQPPPYLLELGRPDSRAPEHRHFLGREPP